MDAKKAPTTPAPKVEKPKAPVVVTSNDVGEQTETKASRKAKA